MDREGSLRIHVSGSIAMNDWAKDRVADPEPLVATADEYRTALFDPIGRKWWADGTPLTKTSLLVGEYADGGHGTMGVDATVRAILDVIERGRRLSPGAHSQTHQISHCLFLRDEDIPRFRELNVVADFSPVIYYRSPQMSVLEEMVGAGNIRYLANIFDEKGE